MVNQKGEFPCDARISARVSGSTKRLLQKLKSKGHTEADVVEYAAKQLSKEPTLIDWEIGELDLEISALESKLYALKSKRQAKLNRLKIIAPKMIDEDTLRSLMLDSAKEYAMDIVSSRDDFNIGLLDNHTAKSSIMSTGEEWGYDPVLFLEEVMVQVEKLLSDKDV